MKKSVLIGIIVAAVVVVGVVLGVVFSLPSGDDGTTTTTTTTSAPACKHDDPTKIIIVDAVAPTCQETGLTEGKKCTLCGTMVVPQAVVGTIECIGGDWIVDKEATKTEDGKRHTECTMCGDVVREQKIAAGSQGLSFENDGDGGYKVVELGSCTDTDIVIPSEYNGKAVTSIGSSVFEDCTSLTSVTIPDSVTSIGDNAFSNCTSLQYNQYDNGLYLGNENNPYIILIKAKNENITSCEIHGDTKFIHSYAFYNCTSLTSIVIPDSVTSIGDWAFWNCTSLQYNQYDNGLYLGNENNPYIILIAVNTNITSCEIHSDTRFIHSAAFWRCTSLTSIEIPDSVTSIGRSAFFDCTSLTSVEIPDSVTSIGNYAFRDCTSLTSINFGGTKAQWDAIEKGNDWNYNTGKYTIYCTDGNISK